MDKFDQTYDKWMTFLENLNFNKPNTLLEIKKNMKEFHNIIKDSESSQEELELIHKEFSKMLDIIYREIRGAPRYTKRN